MPVRLFLFSFGWIALLYALNSLAARRLKTFDVRAMALSVVAVSVIGVFGEVLVDTLYRQVSGFPLWVYHVAPIHGGYTSYFSPVIWGMYGFYLHLLHDDPGLRAGSRLRFAATISLEAIVLELMLNTSYYLMYGGYIFYYLPRGLWHFSAFQAIPFYFTAGYVIARALAAMRSRPAFFAVFLAILEFVFVVCAPGV